MDHDKLKKANELNKKIEAMQKHQAEIKTAKDDRAKNSMTKNVDLAIKLKGYYSSGGDGVMLFEDFMPMIDADIMVLYELKLQKAIDDSITELANL